MNTRIKIILGIISIPIFLYFLPTPLGGDTEFLIVQGKSMLPTITDGSLVITKKSPPYQIDDIVSFTLKEDNIKRIVVHRIIDETENGFVIKGDNNEAKDSGFPTENDIRGKVIFSTPWVGELFEYFRNPVIFFITAIVIISIQFFQKRRRKKKESLRRIRLGLPLNPEKPVVPETIKKKKKSEYSFFYVALSLNVIVYIITQIAIVEHLAPLRKMGDDVTGFLFQMFAPSFASTVSFSLYFVFLFGLYFGAKYYGRKISKPKNSSRRKSGSAMQLLTKQGFNPLLAAAQFFWFMFILMSMFHLISLGGIMIESLTSTCDPTQAIC